ncbi:Glyoxalase-like domain-containing protein [Salinihabitans flavidus]|uniref:Glyoxalase-like domain-containing protein n=1 Tax=Salinihabitans flavidus TaxID=569882 RepID=A0A1H8UDK5_9RHOB|nr:VOC family protein [Salinihabitans flavidus]SEP01309.1 Glyoxalase-like domain-containing protein [Salinihabitans flavidus]
MILDHLAVASETLEAAQAHVEEVLGVAMAPGGKHAHFGTHNRLLGLAEGLYLEAIAIDRAAPKPDYPRWFDLDRFTGPPRLANWICRVDDLDAALAGLPEGAGEPVTLERGDLRWRMAVPDDGILPMQGAFPAVLEWEVPNPPGERLDPSGCRLLRLEVIHPEAARLAQLLPLTDSRVVFEGGDVALRAVFDTPHGERVLT